VKSYFFPGTVPEKSLCPRCAGPLGRERGPLSRVEFEGRRPIMICHDCGLDELIASRNGRQPVPVDDWPIERPFRPRRENNLSLELEGDSAILNGEIRDPTLIRLIEEGEAQGKTADEVMSEVIEKGVETMKELYE
jgi:hypothetical protein